MVAGVGGGVGRGALSAVAAVEVGTGIVATGTGAVVVGVGATGWKKATQARGPAEPVGDDAEAVADRADAGSIAVRTTRERATRVTTPTRAEVPAMGMWRSRTRRRVSELDTPWLSASAASRFKPHRGWCGVVGPLRFRCQGNFGRVRADVSDVSPCPLGLRPERLGRPGDHSCRVARPMTCRWMQG